MSLFGLSEEMLNSGFKKEAIKDIPVSIDLTNHYIYENQTSLGVEFLNNGMFYFLIKNENYETYKNTIIEAAKSRAFISIEFSKISHVALNNSINFNGQIESLKIHFS